MSKPTLTTIIETCIQREVKFTCKYDKETTYVTFGTDIHQSEFKKFDINQFNTWMKQKEISYNIILSDLNFLTVIII